MKKILVIFLSLLFVLSTSFSLSAQSLNKRLGGKSLNKRSEGRSWSNLSRGRGRSLHRLARGRHHRYRPIRYRYNRHYKRYRYYTYSRPVVDRPYFGFGYEYLQNNSLKPGETQYLYPGYRPPPQDISPYASLKNIKPAGEILILVEPVNASVWIDGQLMQQNEDTSFTFGVLTGEHRVKITADGYTTFSETVFVPVGGIPIEVTLEKAESE